MGGSESKEITGTVIHFTDEEKRNISRIFSKISHGNKIITKDQLQSYTGSILDTSISSHLYDLMLTGHKQESAVSENHFLQFLSSALRGDITEKSHIILHLAAEGTSPATAPQLVKCVTELLYSFTRVAEHCKEFKTWMLHNCPDAYNKLALSILEDLFHTGPSKDKGMTVPPVPNASYNVSQIEDWLSKSNLFLLMFEQIFQGCFPIYSHDEEIAHHLTPRLPTAGCVNWSAVKTILDLPSLLYLNSMLPQDKQSEWRLAYSNLIFGDSFTQLVQKITLKGPSVVIIRDKDGHVFGGYACQDWDFNPKFTGDSHCFLFSLKPHFGVYTATGYNDHFMYLNHHVQTLPNGLGMGGQFEFFGLWIDHSFNTGHSKAGPRCTTYGSPQLSGTSEFQVDIIEVWAVGPEKKEDEEDLTDESRKKKSILDKDPEAQAMLSLIGKGPVSEGLRQEDDTAGNPEHNRVVSLF